MQKTFGPSKFPFINKIIDKQQLTELIIWAFSSYGIARATQMADNLKELGFFYATRAGLSLSIEDLHIPQAKRQLLNETIASLHNTDQQYLRAEITIVEKFQKVIDTWHNMNEALREEIIKYFQETDPLNSLYMMSMSGARGNMSQVRQLVGMRGLMSDPNGQIIDLPIISNFREGLTVTEYFISSYGARKGLVDTALRTADSGYLTRRLVDVAQHVIVREANCHTKRGVIIEQLSNNQKVLIPLEQALLGRTTAENIYHPKTGEIIIKVDKCISAKNAYIITNSGITKVLVRSPLTCESDNGICQNCYGWNLAHRKLVDTGEAVGVIAAQSIGEPGTQLTMRTFHTGGVFTGEIAQKIRSPMQGILKYSQNIHLTNIRTQYGELAYLVEKESIVFVESTKHNNIRLILPIGTTLLIHHNSKVSNNQVIALSPVSQQFVTEEAEKRVFADLSGRIVFTNLTLEETSKNQTIARSIMKEGLVWILSGQVYDIPSSSNITVKVSEEIQENTPLAQQKITNQYPGYVRILKSKNRSSKESYEIQIVTAEFVLENSNVSLSNRNFPGIPILETSNDEKFILQVTPGEKLLNAQTIAYLVSDMYKTTTGGIVKYLDLSIANKRSKILKNSYEVLGSGYILWIAEETHEINKDRSLLLVQHGDVIDVGTELIKNIFARIAGVVEVIIKDGAVREIIIKPGRLYISKIQNICLIQKKKRGFLRPGETVNGEFYADKLVYWEYIQKGDQFFILIRPVTVYSIPYKSYSFESDQKNTNLSTQVINTTKFRDGERIKSIYGVDLIKSYIVIYINESFKNLYTAIEYFPSIVNSKKYQLKLITIETLLIKNHYFYSKSQMAQILVKEQQKILANTVVAKIETLAAAAGTVENICKTKNFHYRILVSSKEDEYKFIVSKKETIFVKLFQWIYNGNYISTHIKSPYSGQVVKIQNNTLTLRIARPYLVSNAADLYVNNNDLVLQGESIAVIKFYRPKTKDIVQGLPKIEEILEARKKSEAFFKPHHMLTSTFNQYLNSGINIADAAKLALHELQIHLVKEIQLVYQSQKVDIADKHIEIIVKQMTSKVEIQAGGNTKYLPTELVDINKIEMINKTLISLKQKTALYTPVLLGITKASLNTESFISAASFQETTRVLTEAALSGRLDWLKGLKENVIIGRLIPAGTGFDMYNYSEEKQDNLNKNRNKRFFRSIDADDIILDDRTEHSIID